MDLYRNWNNVICICGSERNVGKTFLGESIIKKFSIVQDIIAVKISKFKHKNHQKDVLNELYKTKYYTIWKETEFSNKDSGRYLQAGAKLSIYIECDDTHLLEAFLYIKKKYCKSCLIVCESASILKYIKPAVAIFVKSINQPIAENKLECFNRSDLVLTSFSIELSEPHLFLSIEYANWIAKYSKKQFAIVKYLSSTEKI